MPEAGRRHEAAGRRRVGHRCRAYVSVDAVAGGVSQHTSRRGLPAAVSHTPQAALRLELLAAGIFPSLAGCVAPASAGALHPRKHPSERNSSALSAMACHRPSPHLCRPPPRWRAPHRVGDGIVCSDASTRVPQDGGGGWGRGSLPSRGGRPTARCALAVRGRGHQHAPWQSCVAPAAGCAAAGSRRAIHPPPPVPTAGGDIRVGRGIAKKTKQNKKKKGDTRRPSYTPPRRPIPPLPASSPSVCSFVDRPEHSRGPSVSHERTLKS